VPALDVATLNNVNDVHIGTQVAGIFCLKIALLRITHVQHHACN